MQRTLETVEVGLAVDWANIKDLIVERIGEMFHDYPHFFFTERDIHSLLCDVANEELRLNGVAETETTDGYLVNLVHHEYPTPFRCDMNGGGFVKKDAPPYTRGHYDLVILNPDFVRRSSLDVVCAKDFELLETEMRNVDATPLVWVCEVVFFPRMKAIPGDAVLQVRQEALKVAETLKHGVGSDKPFCELGSILVLTSHTADRAANLKAEVLSVGEKLGTEIAFLTA